MQIIKIDLPHKNSDGQSWSFDPQTYRLDTDAPIATQKALLVSICDRHGIDKRIPKDIQTAVEDIKATTLVDCTHKYLNDLCKHLKIKGSDRMDKIDKADRIQALIDGDGEDDEDEDEDDDDDDDHEDHSDLNNSSTQTALGVSGSSLTDTAVETQRQLIRNNSTQVTQSKGSHKHHGQGQLTTLNPVVRPPDGVGALLNGQVVSARASSSQPQPESGNRSDSGYEAASSTATSRVVGVVSSPPYSPAMGHCHPPLDSATIKRMVRSQVCPTCQDDSCPLLRTASYVIGEAKAELGRAHQRYTNQVELLKGRANAAEAACTSASRHDSERHQKTLHELQGQLDSYKQAHSAELERISLEHRQQVATLQQEMTAFRDRARDMVRGRQEDRRQFEMVVADFEAAHQELAADRDRAKAEFQARIDILTASLEDSRRQLAAETDKNVKNETQVQALNQEAEAVRRACEARVEAVNRHREAELGSLREKLLCYEGVEDARNDLRDHEARTTYVEQELMAVERKKTQAIQLHGSLMQRGRAHEQEILQLTSQNQDLERALEDRRRGLEEHRARATELQHELQSAKWESEEGGKRADVLQSKLERLHGEIEELQAHRTSLERELVEAQTRKQSLLDLTAAVDQRLEQSRSEEQMLNDRSLDLDQQLAASQEAVERIRWAVQHREQDLSSTQELHSQVDAIRTSLQLEHEARYSQQVISLTERHRQEVDRLQQEWHEDQTTQLEEQRAEYEARLARVKSHASDARTLDKLRGEIHDLEAEKKQMTEKRRHLENLLVQAHETNTQLYDELVASKAKESAAIANDGSETTSQEAAGPELEGQRPHVECIGHVIALTDRFTTLEAQVERLDHEVEVAGHAAQRAREEVFEVRQNQSPMPSQASSSVTGSLDQELYEAGFPPLTPSDTETDDLYGPPARRSGQDVNRADDEVSCTTKDGNQTVSYPEPQPTTPPVVPHSSRLRSFTDPHPPAHRSPTSRLIVALARVRDLSQLLHKQPPTTTAEDLHPSR